jgi:hypothetical protein
LAQLVNPPRPLRGKLVAIKDDKAPRKASLMGD